LCRGTIVYGDYVADDYGADTGAVMTTSRTATLAPTAGDEAYPGPGQDGSADLVRLTLRPRGRRLLVSGLLSALFKPEQTILAVAIDTDNNPATGGGKWGPLDVSSRGWEEIAFFRHGDPAANTISGSMPLPAGRRWRVEAVTAVAATGRVMNVAFRGVDERAGFMGNPLRNLSSDAGAWFEDKQAAALRSGDISQFGYVVDAGALKSGATRLQEVGPGLHERVYTSRYTIAPGKGVNVAGVPGRGTGGSPPILPQSFQYLGRYQPYGIYIPHRPGPLGMQMVFHGTSSDLAGLINQPGMQQRFGEDLGRVLVTPEARGQNGFGSDISERDLLDVMADVEAHYPIDSSKVFAGGYSQGGYITYRMAELYPDRFAGAVAWVGFTGDASNGTPEQGHGTTAGAVGNVIDLVANLRNVPTTMLYSGADELVHAWTARAMDEAFERTDDVFRYFMHPASEHLTFAILDDWRKEAAATAGLTLVRDPPRISYRTDANLDDPAHGIVHDRAYWVSQIRGRGKGYEDVDFTNYACGGTVPVMQTFSGPGTDPLPWVSDGRRVIGTRPLPKQPLVTARLHNISSATIDARAICLTGQGFSYDITTDGNATLTFSDGRTVTLAGAGRHLGTA
jgi:dienelactone hydrolase